MRIGTVFKRENGSFCLFAFLLAFLFAAGLIHVFRHFIDYHVLTKFRADEGADKRRRVGILVGNGGLFLPQELQRGADGAMTGFAFPEMLVQVCRLHAAGDADRAEDLFDAYLPLIRYEQQIGIGLAIRKETFRRRGVIASTRTRAPGPSLDADDQAELSRLIDRLKTRLRATDLAVPEI